MAALLSLNLVERGLGKDGKPVRVGRVFLGERAFCASKITLGIRFHTPTFYLVTHATHPSFGAKRGELNGAKF